MAIRKDHKPKPEPRAQEPAFSVIEPQGGTSYFYANLFQITWTVVDLKIRWAELTKLDPNGHHTVTERAVVTMAWAEAKTLLKSLEKAVSDYEKVNGEIRITPQLKLPAGILPIPKA